MEREKKYTGDGDGNGNGRKDDGWMDGDGGGDGLDCSRPVTVVAAAAGVVVVVGDAGNGTPAEVSAARDVMTQQFWRTFSTATVGTMLLGFKTLLIIRDKCMSFQRPIQLIKIQLPILLARFRITQPKLLNIQYTL